MSTTTFPSFKKQPMQNSLTKSIKKSTTDWLWTLLVTLAFTDVIISYLGNSLHLPLFSHPWQLITGLFCIALIFSFQNIAKIKFWLIATYAGLVFSLLLGYFTIDSPTISFITNAKVPFKILPTDLITMTIAFLIGALWVIRKDIDAKFISSLFLTIAAIHTSICIMALLKIYPSIFPVIDAPYYRNGIMISRPEITTDQTRQVLYLFINLCVIFTQPSFIKRLIAIVISLAIIFILTKVQSRWGTLIFALFTLVAFFMALYYKKLTKLTLFIGIFFAILLIAWKLEAIINFFANLFWRFQQVDSSFGGRAQSILYLFEKLADPSYWIPHGYNEFFKQHGAAPHSFPTMMYLNAGLIGLICYLSVVVLPLYILFKKVITRTASEIENIGFFCGTFAFFLMMTQPVIAHEIFWLIAGLVVGAISKKEPQPNQALKTARQA